MKMEIQALTKETDLASKERLVKLRTELIDKEAERDKLTDVWKREKKLLNESKNMKEELEKLRNDLQRAQRQGDYARASEILYGLIPALERKLPKGDEAAAKLDLLSDAVREVHIAQVVAS